MVSSYQAHKMSIVLISEEMQLNTNLVTLMHILCRDITHALKCPKDREDVDSQSRDRMPTLASTFVAMKLKTSMRFVLQSKSDGFVIEFCNCLVIATFFATRNRSRVTSKYSPTDW